MASLRPMLFIPKCVFRYDKETKKAYMDVSVEKKYLVFCKNCWKLGYDNCPMDDYFDIHPMEPDFYCAAGEPEEMRPRGGCEDVCEIGGESNDNT